MIIKNIWDDLSEISAERASMHATLYRLYKLLTRCVLVLAETLVMSTQTIFIFIIKNYIYTTEVSKQHFMYFL